MESSKHKVLMRGAISGFDVGGDGGGVACDGPSGERGFARGSGSEYGSRVNYCALIWIKKNILNRVPRPGVDSDLPVSAD